MQVTFTIYFNMVLVKYYIICFTNPIVDYALLLKSVSFITYLPTENELAEKCNAVTSQSSEEGDVLKPHDLNS